MNNFPFFILRTRCESLSGEGGGGVVGGVWLIDGCLITKVYTRRPIDAIEGRKQEGNLGSSEGSSLGELGDIEATNLGSPRVMYGSSI